MDFFRDYMRSKDGREACLIGRVMELNVDGGRILYTPCEIGGVL